MSTGNVTAITSPKTKTIVRLVKSRDFLQVSHVPLYHARLSLKAKGLLCLMLSMSDEWEFRRDHLLTLCSDGRDSLRAGLKELEEAGYIILNSERDEKGRIQKWIMSVHEVPIGYKHAQEPSRSGNSASGQVPTAATDTEALSRSGFSTSGKPACNNINNNNINNNNVVAAKIKSKIPNMPITTEVILGWVDAHGEAYVLTKIELMQKKGKISNPLGWLTMAIEKDYKDAPKGPTPPSHEIWTASIQEQRNAAAEKNADPLDWRDKAMQDQLTKLTSQMRIKT